MCCGLQLAGVRSAYFFKGGMGGGGGVEDKEDLWLLSLSTPCGDLGSLH